jgi:hypothetical protein
MVTPEVEHGAMSVTAVIVGAAGVELRSVPEYGADHPLVQEAFFDLTS